MTGYPVIAIEGALGGETIDLGYAEALESPTGELVSPASGARGVVNPDRAAVHNADRYICREGTQRFQTFDKRAFRYLQIDVRNLRRKISIGPVSLIFSSYPVEYRGSFACSDDLLNSVWEVGRWTAQLNMEDAYSDSPWRERAQWWGDVRIEALVSYYTFGDGRLVRQGIRHIAQSQRPDGLTMGIYPTSWTGGVLPTYTLLWVISLRDYTLYTGDRALLREIFSAVERAMEFFDPYLSRRGLLGDLPHWLFVDWAPVATGGESTAVNALYLGALRATAQMAAELGDPEREDTYRDRADRVQQAMRQNLWDPKRTRFREAPLDDRLEPRCSEQANCWAIVFGAAPEETAGAILKGLLSEEGADVRIGTPYFAFYLLQALARASAHEKALAYIRSRWGAMLDWGATSWWETWEPKASLCHGWSAGPTSFLLSDILGAQPARAGWEEILVEPHPAGLTWAKGVIPTPRGELRIEWEVGEKLLMQVQTPAPCAVRLPPEWPRVSRITGARNIKVPGAVKLTEPGLYVLECIR